MSNACLIILLVSTISMGAFANDKKDKKVKPCKDFYTISISEKKDRAIASLEKYNEIISIAIAEEDNSESLRYFAGYLLNTTNMNENDKSISLYILADYLRQNKNVKIFEADCLSGKLAERYKK